MDYGVEYISNFEEVTFNILAWYSGKACNLMISGGSILSVLGSKDYTKLDSSKWTIFFADERVNKKALNFTQSQNFLKMLSSRVFQIDIGDNLEKSVTDYELVLQNNVSHIDVCFLGIGENGHICSIWPYSPILTSERLVELVEVDCTISPLRITTTVNFINRYVKNLFFVVPPKDGIVKSIKSPHHSILEHLRVNFSIFLADTTVYTNRHTTC